MKNFLLTLSLLFSLLLSAQEVEQNKLKKSSRCSVSDIKKGTGFTAKDSLFQLNLDSEFKAEWVTEKLR
jgi:hypothetical protein